MSSQLLIDGSQKDQIQIALIENQKLKDFEYESKNKKHLKGNVYLGKVTRIEASLQAAFVDIGSEKNGFLAFGEIHPNYFQIPIADKEALIAAEATAELEHQIENEEIKNNESEINLKKVSSEELNENQEVLDQKKKRLNFQKKRMFQSLL